jgi:hypothetical protein
MLGKFFGKKEAKPVAQNGTIDPAQAAMKHALEEKRKTDPLIGAKLCAKELNQKIIDSMSKIDSRGVHVDTLLVAMASVGGFACQMAIREGIIKTGQATEQQVFVSVKGKDGATYYMGDTLNDALLSGKFSFYSYAGGGVERAGGKKLPDINEIAGYVASTIGTENFGMPRYPEGHNAAETPSVWVKTLWPLHLPILQFYCASPIEWPVTYGIALQEIIVMAKDALNPELAIQMAIEAAMPMSKIDYREIEKG